MGHSLNPRPSFPRSLPYWLGREVTTLRDVPESQGVEHQRSAASPTPRADQTMAGASGGAHLGSMLLEAHFGVPFRSVNPFPLNPFLLREIGTGAGQNAANRRLDSGQDAVGIRPGRGRDRYLTCR